MRLLLASLYSSSNLLLFWIVVVFMESIPVLLDCPKELITKEEEDKEFSSTSDSPLLVTHLSHYWKNPHCRCWSFLWKHRWLHYHCYHYYYYCDLLLIPSVVAATLLLCHHVIIMVIIITLLLTLSSVTSCHKASYHHSNNYDYCYKRSENTSYQLLLSQVVVQGLEQYPCLLLLFWLLFFLVQRAHFCHHYHTHHVTLLCSFEYVKHLSALDLVCWM